MKSLINAIFHQTLWPIPEPKPWAPLEPSRLLIWGSALGVASGVAAAATFLITGLLLPVRVAIFLALLVGLSGSIPRSASALNPGHANPMGLTLTGVLLLLKLEILAEIDQDWVAVTLICSSAWARAAILGGPKAVFVRVSPASGKARLTALVIGALPLIALGIWPEPVWGLWVAAILTWVVAIWVRPSRWASHPSTRCLLAEVVFCLSVLVLLSAAAMTEIAAEEETEF